MNIPKIHPPKTFRFGSKKSAWHNHPFVIPVTVGLTLFFVSCASFVVLGSETIGANDTKVVSLYIDGQTRIVPTRASTVGDVLKRAGIELREGDLVEPSTDTEFASQNFNINIYRAKPVTVIDNKGEKVIAKVVDSSPDEMAKKAGVKVYPEDNVTIAAPADALKAGVIGAQVIIDRATPTFINLYGASVPARTHAKTVGELLSQKGIKTLEGDTITPSVNTPISDNLQVFVVRVGKQILTVEEELPAPIEKREDASKTVGTSIIVEPGAPGKRIVTYELEVTNGKETLRKEIQSIVTQEPRKRILIVGTKRAGFDGNFEAALAKLRSCEGSYTSATGNGYYGAYQFDIRTWNNYLGYSNASLAPPHVQDQKAWETYQRRGWQPWPGCTKKLGLQDIYR